MMGEVVLHVKLKKSIMSIKISLIRLASPVDINSVRSEWVTGDVADPYESKVGRRSILEIQR